MRRREVAVVGLGALGASVLWQLARRGVDAVGIDQFLPPHAYGSTHGRTRLFRRACLEHPDLYAWATRSAELFDDLGARAGRVLLRRTGGVVMGLPGSEAVAGTALALERAGVMPELLDAAALRRRFPHHAGIRDDEVGVVDSEAGAVDPEGYVTAALTAAVDGGGRVLSGVRILGVEADGDGVRVRTPVGDVLADQVVLAAGAWLSAFLPDLPLDPIRTPMTWFSPRTGAAPHGIDDLGVFVREIDDETMLWGHGSLNRGHVKLGLADTHGRERPGIDPDRFDRGVQVKETSVITAAVRRWLPGLVPEPMRVDPCMITRTPDDQFLVGRWDERTLVAGGDSGHAFKHAPAIGETIAQQVVGEPVPLPTEFVDPHRFDGAGAVSAGPYDRHR